jgi:hypothetical protein
MAGTPNAWQIITAHDDLGPHLPPPASTFL